MDKTQDLGVPSGRVSQSDERHTSGPWAVNPAVAQVDAFANGVPVVICQLAWPTDLRDEEETVANAHLIAAAPDMLAALKEILELIYPRGIEEPAHPCVAKGYSAIAKAEGR